MRLRADETRSERDRISEETCFNVSKCDGISEVDGDYRVLTCHRVLLPSRAGARGRNSEHRVYLCLFVSFSGLRSESVGRNADDVDDEIEHRTFSIGTSLVVDRFIVEKRGKVCP
jgi:hypothetical protein